MESSAKVSADSPKIVWYIAVFLQTFCLGWALLFLETGFTESGRYPINRDFRGHIRVYTLAFLPLLLLTLATWFARPKRSKLFWLLAILPTLLGVLIGWGRYGENPAEILRMTGPFAAYATLVVWLNARSRVSFQPKDMERVS